MGKAAIIMVLGFAMVLAYVMPNSYRHANDAYSNYEQYYEITMAHNIATSAANIAADSVFWKNDWSPNMTNISFSGGKFSVTRKDTTAMVLGLPQNWAIIRTAGTFGSNTQTVEVKLAPGNFAQFGYYSAVEGGINWITGDTVWGRFHSQDVMTISGKPVFMGKVTNLKGTSPKKSTAIFNGSYQTGVNIPMPGNLNAVTNAATAGGKVYSAGDLWITFSDSVVQWKTSAAGTVTSTNLHTFAPNGVIEVSNGNLHIQGRFNGQATVVAVGTGKGNIYIDDDVTYKNNPQTGASTDLLGIVALNNIIVTDNVANGSNCNIQAALFCLNGGLTAENYNRSTGTNPPVLRGTLSLYGGVTQYQRGAVGTSSGGTIQTGFLKRYRYDDRLALSYPPFYPMTGGYQIISWLE